MKNEAGRLGAKPLRTEHEKVKREMARLYKLYMGEHITPEGFGVHHRPLEERTSQIEAELPRLRAEVDFLAMRLASSEVLIEAAQDLYSRWQNLPFEERRTMVESLVERITVGDGEIDLSLLYLPSGEEILANEGRILRDS